MAPAGASLSHRAMNRHQNPPPEHGPNLITDGCRVGFRWRGIPVTDIVDPLEVLPTWLAPAEEFSRDLYDVAENSSSSPLVDDTIHANLQNLPYDIIGKICSYLGAIWIYNLSHVSSNFYRALNGPDANAIWYEAMPKALWRKQERFQDADELSVWADEFSRRATRFRQECTDGTPSPGFENDSEAMELDDEKATLELFPELSSQKGVLDPVPPTTPDSEDSPLLFGSATLDEDQAAFMPPWPEPIWSDPSTAPNSPDTAKFLLSPSVQFAERKPVMALKGPYRVDSSYKREIMGHIMQGKRCSICCNMQNFHMNVTVSIRAWGLKWCARCFSNWTIGLPELNELLQSVFTVRRLTCVADHGGENFTRKYSEGATRRLFIPAVDSYLQALGLDGLSELTDLENENAVNKAKDELRRTSDVSKAGRRLRVNIIAAAELHWEGVDPDPLVKISHDAEGKVSIQEISRPGINADRFRCFRERFAPTHLLKTFLFPEDTVSDCSDPFGDPKNAKLRFPPDPTEFLSSERIRRLLVDKRWISTKAEEMLVRLTHIGHPEYNRPGRGGQCSLWIKAVNEYHRRRLSKELDVAIQQTDLRLFEFKTRKMSYSLEGRLGIKAFVESAGLSPNLNLRAQLFPPISKELADVPEVLEQMMQDSRLVQREIDLRLSHAKKIIFATCKRCPVTKLLVTRKGIKSTLLHVREFHPYDFWSTDDWHLIG